MFRLGNMGMATTFWYFIIATFAAILYSNYLGNVYVWSELNIQNVIAGWEEVILKPDHKGVEITLGFNAAVDLIVNGSETLKGLNMKASNNPDLLAVLNDLQDLEQLFCYSFENAAGVERPFFNGNPFKQATEAASQIPGAQWFIGGNAGLMAQKIAGDFPDLKVNLVAPIGPKLRELLNPNIVVCQACNKTADEIHLILEYQVGEKWGDHTAQVANRMITSYDRVNSEAQLLDDIFITASRTQSQFIIISGLHMLEAEPIEFKASKLQQLVSQLTKLPQATVVHLELASMSDADFIREIALQVLPLVTSLGLNEQELSFLTESLGRDGTRGQPRQHVVYSTRMIGQIIDQFGLHPTERPNNRLTRIHFHCLTFHLIATTSDFWFNSESAVAAGARVASSQACDMPVISPDKVRMSLPSDWIKLSASQSHRFFNSSRPVHTWTEDNTIFSYTPSLICKEPLKTVGLGDAISATGLLYSTFSTPKGS